MKTLETIDRLEEFARSPHPDNRMLQYNLDALATGLSQVHAASAQTRIAVPAALVRDVVDAGASPDDFSAQLFEQAELRSDALEAKRKALSSLQRAVRDGGQGL